MLYNVQNVNRSIAKNYRTTLYGWLTVGSLFLNRCNAIGIVVASPDKNKDQPTVLRFALNLSASSRPAPNPIIPRVAAMSAICGTVNVLGFGIFILSPYFH